MSTKQSRLRSGRTQRSLAEWRESHGFNQRDAAHFLGISQPYYSKLERHAQAPRPAIAKQLTAKTGVPVEELMGIAS